MIHRRILIIWMVLIFMLAGGGVGPVSADVKVRQLTLARHGVFTELAIHAPGRLLCNHFIEEPKFGKPFRVVLDLCGAIHQLDQQNFESVPSGVVARIRTSQYANMPQNVVRVVLDLVREVTYKVSVDEGAIIISLVTPGEPEFEPWSSTSAKSEPVRTDERILPEKDDEPTVFSTADIAPTASAEEPTTTGCVEKPKTQVAERRESALKDVAQAVPAAGEVGTRKNSRRLELVYGPYEEVYPKKPIPDAGIQEELNKRLARHTAQFDSPAGPAWEEPVGDAEDKKEIVSAGVEEQVEEFTSTIEVKHADKSEERAASQKRLVRPVAQYDSPVGPAWPEKPLVASLKGEGDFTSPVAQAEPGEIEPAVGAEQPEEPIAPEDSMPFSGEEYVEKAPPTAVSEEPQKLSLLARLRQKFFKPAAKEQARLDASADSTARTRIRALAGIPEETAPEYGVQAAESTQTPSRRIDRAELEKKIASVDPSAVKPGSISEAGETKTDLEKKTVIPTDKGQPVQAEATRKKVGYDRAGRRDPFAALIEGQRSGLRTTALPRVDALRLVGILQDYDGAIALFEDMEGYGYILHEGDPVKYGYVKTIGENRVLFHVEDYGWVHTVVLELRKDASSLDYDYATELEDE